MFFSPQDATTAPKSNGTTPTITVKSSPIRSKTQISSVYAKLSSVKPTTTSSSVKNSSIPTTNNNNLSAKPMKTTKIEHPSPSRMQSAANVIREPVKSPRRAIPTLTKPNNLNSKATKIIQQKSNVKIHLDDSNGNSATSSLSTSSSNSSLNTSGNCLLKDAPTSLANQLNHIYKRGLVE